MNLLIINTASSICHIAFAQTTRTDWKVPNKIQFRADKNTDKKFVPSVEKVLKKAKVQIKNLHGIILAAGPGSFTGLRISFAFASAIHSLYKTTIFPIGTLEGFKTISMEENSLVVPVIDARRSSIYASAYKKHGSQIKVLLPPKRFSIEELTKKLNKLLKKDQVLFTGDALGLIKKELIGKSKDKKLATPDPDMLLKTFLYKIKNKEKFLPINSPAYLCIPSQFFKKAKKYGIDPSISLTDK